jgi:hypothetical protein
MTPIIIVVATIYCLSGIVAWRYVSAKDTAIGLTAVAIFAVIPVLLESRRSIVFTTNQIIYKRNTGSLVRVNTEDLAGVFETSTVYMLGARPTFVPAVKLLLRSGVDQTIPLDFDSRDEIVQRLRTIAARSRPGVVQHQAESGDTSGIPKN